MPASSSIRLRRTWRYLRAWQAGGPPTVESEFRLDRGDTVVPVSLFLPAHDPRPPVGWIVLHGITRPGRFHPTLLRFARSLAATGAAVMVPEVPEWIDLQLAPGRTLPTVRAALPALTSRLVGAAPGPESGGDPPRVGLIGFSFGAPQALVAAGDPTLAGALASVASFGGYFDLERTFRFLLTGEEEWEGQTRHRRPDPYGRWIVAANFLAGVPGYHASGPVCAALRELAREAGDRRLPADDPAFDPVKDRLARPLTRDERALFRLFAPPATADLPLAGVAGAEWASRLAAAGRAAEPLADPREHLGAPAADVHLLHGRGDDLIPSTETLHLARYLRAQGRPPAQLTITGLLAHSASDHRRHPLGRLREVPPFARALSRLFAL